MKKIWRWLVRKAVCRFFGHRFPDEVSGRTFCLRCREVFWFFSDRFEVGVYESTSLYRPDGPRDDLARSKE